jgi:glycine cleavage system aminomethyltransferase T
MGLGFVRPDLNGPGTPLQVDVRGTIVEATAVERPFYKNASHR